MGKVKILGLLFLIISGILNAVAEELKSGDLIFIGEGNGEFSKAITEATASNDSVRFVHVGIVESDERGNRRVIEASPEEGVREIALDKFIETAPYFVIKRLSISFPVENMLEKAKSYLGEEYDWWYLPENGKMYCSELVYESFLDKEGNHIFEAQPMNFRASDGSMPQFWINLFDELGEPIPEGIPGTNPSDLSRSQFLYTIQFNQ